LQERLSDDGEERARARIVGDPTEANQTKITRQRHVKT
jgi:hypothetical protein